MRRLIITLGLSWLALGAAAQAVAPAAPAEAAAAASSEAGSFLQSKLRNAEVIEAMGMLPSLRARWYAVHEKFLNQHAEVSEKLGTISATTRFVRLSVQSLGLGLGAYLVIIGEMSPGMMIAGSILMGKVLGPVELLINVWRQWSGVRSASERLVALLDANPPRETGGSLQPLQEIDDERQTRRFQWPGDDR